MRCTLTRWRLSRHADDGGELPSRVAAHLTGCEPCCRYRSSLESLADKLGAGRTDAPRPLTEEPARPARTLGLVLVTGALAAAAAFVLLREPDVSVVEHVETPSFELTRPAPTPEPPPDADVDVHTLASDAQDGLRYVLRVSGLKATRN